VANHGKDFMIQACTVLIQSQSVTDRQTHRRMPWPWPRRAKHYMPSRVKSEHKQKLMNVECNPKRRRRGRRGPRGRRWNGRDISILSVPTENVKKKIAAFLKTVRRRSAFICLFCF